MARRRVFEQTDEDYLLDPEDSAPQFTRTDREVADRARAGRSTVSSAPAVSAPKSQPKAVQHTPAAAPNLLLQPSAAFLAPERLAPEGQAERAANPVGTPSPVDAGPSAVLLKPNLPPMRGGVDAVAKPVPTPLALEFMRWVQSSLVERSIKYNETAAVVHFVPQGMALVSPLIFKLFAEDLGKRPEAINDYAMQVQRELIRAGWHLAGPSRTNIIKFAVLGRGGAAVGRLAAVVLTDPGRWVQPVPPSNPVLRVE